MGEDPPGTFFPPQKATSDLKKWVAHTGGYAKGRVYINEGAKKALYGPKATSLLPVGVVRQEGDFKKGDVVEIKDDSGLEVGLGIARYDAQKLAEKIGLKHEQPFIHYDYLFLF
jgi:glutamate 5-kinase